MFWWLTTVCDAYFFSGRTQKEALEDGKKIQRPDLQVKRYELFFTTKVMLWCISLLLSAWRRSLNVSQNIMNLKIWLKGIQLVFIISPTHSLSSTISLLSLYWLLNRYITVGWWKKNISWEILLDLTTNSFSHNYKKFRAYSKVNVSLDLRSEGVKFP